MDRQLLDHLLQSDALTRPQARALVAALRASGGQWLDRAFELEGVDEVRLARALGAFHGLRVVDIGRVKPGSQALAAAPPAFCAQHRLLPFSIDRKSGDLLVAVADPGLAADAVARLAHAGGHQVRVYVAPARALLLALATHHPVDGEARGRAGDGAPPLSDATPVAAAGRRAAKSLTEVSTMARVPDLRSGVLRLPDDDRRDRRDHHDPHDHHDVSEAIPRLGTSLFAAHPGGASGAPGLFALDGASRAAPDGEGLRALRDEVSALRDEGLRALRDEVSALRAENDALRRHLQRVERSLTLEVELVRQLTLLLLEEGAIDRQRYIDRLSQLR